MLSRSSINVCAACGMAQNLAQCLTAVSFIMETSTTYIRACVYYSQTAQVDVQKITDIQSAFDDQWIAAGVGATEGKRSSHGVKAVLQLVGRSRSPCLLGLLFLR